MRIIVPMAGMGKRLRPHTLTTAKPLLNVAGKPIVQRLVEDIVAVSHEKVEEIAYVVGQFGADVERELVDVAERLGAKGTIHYQDQPLGTAHAILCAASALRGPVTVAFADTLFRADFSLDHSLDGVLWVQKIEDPRQFGVIVTDQLGLITGFVEKPQTFVSDLAMIGIYYFRDGENLRNELQFLIDNHIMNGGEYQLPDALRNMMNKGAKFGFGAVSDWMDCGNKDAVIDTNRKVLDYLKHDGLIKNNPHLQDALIIEPCVIGKDVRIINSVVGPHATIGDGATIANSRIHNAIIGKNTMVNSAVLANAMVGNNAVVSQSPLELSLGDFSVIEC
jgi:glucose-1-phosphate thymidylyltransferase